ncbi:MAG: hypothetical protein HZA51_12970 [Planctomycetes bacterium]|nr:hypothetical protein [Planctomycetota bacterium]
MISTAFNLDAFTRDESLVARLVPAADLFSLLTRQFVVPPSCVALVWGDASHPAFVRGGQSIDSGGVREVLFVKSMPIPVRFGDMVVASRDGFEFKAALNLSVQIVPERTELELFRKSFIGSRNSVDATALGSHVETAVRQALAIFANQNDAASLASTATQQSFNAVLAEHFQPIGFSTGLTLAGDIRATFQSPAFADFQRDQQAATRRAERVTEESKLRTIAAEARKQHLDDLAAILDRAQQTAKSSGGAGVIDLIRTFDVSRRGELYRGLMSLGANQCRTEAILVVAGQELLWFSPNGGEKPTRRDSLPSTLGPLRSIRIGQRGEQGVLLVGARNGVFVLDPKVSAEPTSYSFTAPGTLRGGVNAACILGDSLYASHSEAGLIRWRLAEPTTSQLVLSESTRGAKAVRDVQPSGDGRLWFTVDSRVLGWRPDTEEAPIVLYANATIHSLFVEGRDVYAGLDSGAIVHWDLRDTETANVLQSPGGDAVHSLVGLAGGGAPRLLSADKRTHLTLRVLGESYHAEYRWKKPLRWAAGADDVIVAVDDLRDSLVLWRPDVPEEPTATIPVARAHGHAIQDIALLPM